MMRFCALAVLSFFVIGNSQASSLSVYQESAPGAGDFNENLLGTIQTFSTTGTLAEFYDYRLDEFKNTTAVSLTRDQSHLFLVDASDGLGLFVVHDDGIAGNSGGRAETRVDLSGDIASFLVLDDGNGDNNRDHYTETGTLFTAVNEWVGSYTDGYVIGSLDGNWILDIQFTDVSSIDTDSIADGDPTIDDLLTWAALSPDGAGGQTEIALDLVEGQRVRISAVPLPASIWLFLTGVLGLIRMSRRKKAI